MRLRLRSSFARSARPFSHAFRYFRARKTLERTLFDGYVKRKWKATGNQPDWQTDLSPVRERVVRVRNAIIYRHLGRAATTATAAMARQIDPRNFRDSATAAAPREFGDLEVEPSKLTDGCPAICSEPGHVLRRRETPDPHVGSTDKLLCFDGQQPQRFSGRSTSISTTGPCYYPSRHPYVRMYGRTYIYIYAKSDLPRP